MKKVIAVGILMAICTIALPQQEYKSDSTKNDTLYKKSSLVRHLGIVETGYSWGLGDYGQSVYRINIVNAFRFTHYSIGLGLGFSKLIHTQNTYEGIRFDYQVPIYIDNRVYISKKKIRPYFAGGVGLSIMEHQMLGDLSLFLNSSAGIFWKISYRVSMIIGISYESYKIKYEDFFNKYLHYSHTLGFNIGFTF